MLNVLKASKGIYTWANDDVDEGDWLKGERTCKGKYTWVSGDSCEGDWLNGELKGNRKYMFSNVDIYEGEFLNDKKTGKEKIVLTDGRVRKGFWRDGEFVETKADRKKAAKGRIAKIAQYKRIFNAFFLDKSSNVDIQLFDIKEAVKKSCEFIAKDPSLLEIWKYD